MGRRGRRKIQEVGSADEKDKNQVTEKNVKCLTCVQIDVREVMIKKEKVQYAASAWAGRKTAQVYRSAIGASSEYLEIEGSMEWPWIRQKGSYTPLSSKGH